LVILPDHGIEIVGIEKKVILGRVTRSAYWLNHDPSGMVERVTVRRRSNSVTVHQRNGVSVRMTNTERVTLHRHRKRLRRRSRAP
jgi:hypothetical protein